MDFCDDDVIRGLQNRFVGSHGVSTLIEVNYADRSTDSNFSSPQKPAIVASSKIRGTVFSFTPIDRGVIPEIKPTG